MNFQDFFFKCKNCYNSEKIKNFEVYFFAKILFFIQAAGDTAIKIGCHRGVMGVEFYVLRSLTKISGGGKTTNNKSQNQPNVALIPHLKSHKVKLHVTKQN